MTELNKQLAALLHWPEVKAYSWEDKVVRLRRNGVKHTEVKCLLKVVGSSDLSPPSGEGLLVRGWRRSGHSVEYTLIVTDGAAGTPTKSLFMEP